MCEEQCNLQLALADLGSELDVLLGSAGNLLGRHVVGCWVMTAGWVVVVVAGKEKENREERRCVFRGRAAVWAPRFFAGRRSADASRFALRRALSSRLSLHFFFSLVRTPCLRCPLCPLDTAIRLALTTSF